jgi:steroid delta-isomerase-like uncharacterized protein
VKEIAMTKTDLIASYADAWNAHDSERVAAHFADDGVREWEVVMNPLIGGPTRFTGPNDIATGVKAFMDALPDLAVEARTLVETSDGAVLEWMVRGTHQGAWGGWTGQDEPVELPGVSVFRVREGKLAEERMYFDPDVMARNWAPPAG